MSLRHTTARLLATAGAAAVLAIAPVAAAGASAGVTQVDGLMVPDQAAACTDDAASLATYVVNGSLTGCWYVDTFDVQHQSNAGGFVSSGQEQFVGCLGTRCGRIFTTYTFTAKFVGDVEAHGRCHHPITGGTGGFAGVGGVINMHDLPDGCSVYSGHLSL